MIIEENKGRVKIISKIRFSKSDLYYFKFEDRDPRNFYKYMYLTSGLFSWWGWHLVDDAGCRGLPGYRYIYTIAICEEFAELQICYAKRCKIRTWPTLAHETSGTSKKWTDTVLCRKIYHGRYLEDVMECLLKESSLIGPDSYDCQRGNGTSVLLILSYSDSRESRLI